MVYDLYRLFIFPVCIHPPTHPPLSPFRNMGSVVFTLLFIYGEPSLVQGFRIVGWTVLVASFSVWYALPFLSSISSIIFSSTHPPQSHPRLLSPERLEFGHRLVDVSMHSNRSLEEMLAEEEEGEEEGEGGKK